jgi:hypothetical protein
LTVLRTPEDRRDGSSIVQVRLEKTVGREGGLGAKK